MAGLVKWLDLAYGYLLIERKIQTQQLAGQVCRHSVISLDTATNSSTQR
jgi:hypothetical protein